jgi:hypothetical protein
MLRKQIGTTALISKIKALTVNTVNVDFDPGFKERPASLEPSNSCCVLLVLNGGNRHGHSRSIVWLHTSQHSYGKF